MTGLVTVREIDLDRETVLDAGDARIGERAAQQATGGVQAFDFQHVGIGAFVERARAGQRHERVGNHLAPAARAGAGGLHHQHFAEAVDHQARQAIGLAVHEAHAAVGRGGQQSFTHGDGRRQACREEGRVDHDIFAPGPDAHADVRHRVPRAVAEKASVVGIHADAVAELRRALHLVDGAREDPRMTAQQGAFAVAFENDFLHGLATLWLKTGTRCARGAAVGPPLTRKAHMLAGWPSYFTRAEAVARSRPAVVTRA
jgi:hypothetical protein